MLPFKFLARRLFILKYTYYTIVLIANSLKLKNIILWEVYLGLAK